MKGIISVLTLAVLVAIVAGQEGGGESFSSFNFGSLGGGGGSGSSGGNEGGSSEGHHHKHHEKEIVYHDHPKYHFEYKVADHKHHDYHNQHEIRDGHKVKGVYSLLEPDGKTIRVVEYEADKKDGFRAVVKHKIHH